jgi:hypothetical protein
MIKQIYDRDYLKRWKEVQKKLEEKRIILASSFEEVDIMSSWEEMIQVPFPFPCFEVELIDTVTTMGNSLLAERDGFYAHAPKEMLINIISHEIGT